MRATAVRDERPAKSLPYTRLRRHNALRHGLDHVCDIDAGKIERVWQRVALGDGRAEWERRIA
jgi:hypothetical protein